MSTVIDGEELSKADGTSIDVSGLRTFYVKQGDGPPVLLIHGGAPGGAALVNWGRAIRPLAEAGFTVYSYDQPGFGYSDSPTDFSLEFRVAHALAFVETLGLKQFHVIGNSQGAYIAARVTLEHSGVRRLVLVSSGTLAPAGAADAKKQAEMHAAELRAYVPTLANMREMTKKTLFRQDLVTDRLVQLRHELSTGNNFEANQRRHATPPPRALHDELRSLKNPVLLFGGKNDRGVGMDRMLRLFELIPHAEMHLFDDCAHWVQWDQADRFVQLTAEFLSLPG